jgi:hypothetical protein
LRAEPEGDALSEPSKLEPALAALLDPAHPDLAPLRAAAATPDAPELVHVLIKYTGDAADLEAAGFQAWSVRRHPTDGFAIAAGPIPRDRLGELDAIGHVAVVEGSRPMLAELNHSVPEINADQLHSGSPPQQGAGVVVGIIDSGIDIFHHTFRKPDGSTRILGIWDQHLKPGETFHHGQRTWTEQSPD